MKKLTKLESFGLIAAILVGGTYFYMKKVYDPEAASLLRTRKQLQSTIREYNKLADPPSTKKIKRQVEKMHQEMEKLAEKVRQAGGRTEATAEITEALADLSKVAQNTRMRVVELSLGQEKETPLYSWKLVHVRLQGQFSDFVDLTHSLKMLPRPVQLHDIAMENSENDFGDVTITAVLWI